MSTILHGFEYNDATTPAPWGPRETTWNRQMINTLVVGTYTGAMDEAGHKHTKIYDDPTGTTAFDSTTLGAYSALATITAAGTTGGQTSTIVLSGSAYTSSSIALNTGAADNTHLATMTMASGLGTGTSTDRGSIALQTGTASVKMATGILTDAPYVNIDAGSSSIHSKASLIDIISGTTDSSHARIQLNGNANTSSSIEMFVDSDAYHGGSITLQGGYKGGLDDVPINLFTDNDVVIGRGTTTNTNVGELEANFGGNVAIKSWTSSLTLYGYEGITMSTPKLGAVTMITGDASVVKNLHVDGDVYTYGLTQYTGTSVVGFSGTPSKSVWYSKLGKQVHCWFAISGTSNSGELSFTLPFVSANPAPITFRSLTGVINDSTSQTGSFTLSDTTVSVMKNVAGDTFLGSGAKGAEGYLTYLTA